MASKIPGRVDYERMASAASAFLIVQLRRLAPQVVSHFGCAAENMPLRQIVLRRSELTSLLRFSYCLAPAPSPSSRFGLPANGKEHHLL
ncbi:hypothetical protein SAMN04487975_1222 [Planococcus glaciei]|nr:hypothetical protein SAMN04487975_1222 [Planococcus glaciei]